MRDGHIWCPRCSTVGMLPSGIVCPRCKGKQTIPAPAAPAEGDRDALFDRMSDCLDDIRVIVDETTYKSRFNQLAAIRDKIDFSLPDTERDRLAATAAGDWEGGGEMTHEQSEIIRQCIAALWDIESGQEDATECETVFIARTKLENYWYKYRPDQPPIAQRERI